ncbi:MAG: lysine 2,3-aminomutase [Spirochaetaceae bacterium]|nr:MAG: lysine 2,3-aminomutase [Spirochaetaceae bacterium]
MAEYHAYTARSIHRHPCWQKLAPELREAVEVVSHVLPFRVNDYVLDRLIDWSQVPDDPMFQLTFPQRGMLAPADYESIARLSRDPDRADELSSEVRRVRLSLNPHPDGQLELNVPLVEGEPIPGLQHKYAETVLFFPAAGQTCHAYCTFCFRWPQFVGMPEYRFAARETDELIAYLSDHTEVTDLLLTGGDPMVMTTDVLRRYVDPLLEAELPHLTSIRIGTKSISYWPARYVTDDDADDLLALFRRIVASGRNLVVMAHINHPRELSTELAVTAVRRIRDTGAQIRTQSPLVRHINDDPAVWAELWRRCVHLGIVPYYFFVERDTGARDYFSVPLVEAWRIFREAAQTVSGLARTVRGPSMSTTAGKIELLGPAIVHGERCLALRFLQGRNPDWTYRPFFARYSETATWIDELEPAFGEPEFFFMPQLRSMMTTNPATSTGSPAISGRQ